MDHKLTNILKIIWKALRYLFFTFAFFCLFLLLFSFTSGPFWIYYWLGTGNSGYNFEPDYIIVLGGGGMPSESGLIRTYYAAKLADFHPGSEIVVCLPGDTSDTSSSVFQMKREIEDREIDPFRIHLSGEGTNTRYQALDLANKYPFLKDRNVILITSPEHMYRSVMTFRKAGFLHIGGIPAFERAIESNILFDDDKLGGNKRVPGVGGSVQLRYQFWNHIKYEIMIMREFLAISYYKLKGWA